MKINIEKNENKAEYKMSFPEGIGFGRMSEFFDNIFLKRFRC
jgi:hypothetical protein